MVGQEKKTAAVSLCQTGTREEHQSRGTGVWKKDSKSSSWEVCTGMCEYDFSRSVWTRIIKF